SGALKVARGATVNALSGANIVLATTGQTTINSGVIEVENGATLTLGGTVSNTGTLFTDGILNFAGVVKGGASLIANGVIDIQRASSENVAFQSGGTGGLELAVASAYTGKVSGFGSNSSQFIDLSNINSVGATVSYNSMTSSSGVLRVTSGGHTVASINMVGQYTTADFHPGSDSSGHLQITDPPVVEQQRGNAPATIAADTVLEVKVPDAGKVTFEAPTGMLWLDHPGTFTGVVAGFEGQDVIDLPSIAFNAHTTLGYEENNNHTGETLTISDGAQMAKIALLGQYIAGSFVSAADGHGGTLVS